MPLSYLAKRNQIEIDGWIDAARALRAFNAMQEFRLHRASPKNANDEYARLLSIYESITDTGAKPMTDTDIDKALESLEKLRKKSAKRKAREAQENAKGHRNKVNPRR